MGVKTKKKKKILHYPQLYEVYKYKNSIYF